MNPKKLYKALGIHSHLYSDAPVPKVKEIEPFYDSIRYIKVDSPIKANELMSTIRRYMDHKSSTALGFLEVYKTPRVDYYRYNKQFIYNKQPLDDARNCPCIYYASWVCNSGSGLNSIKEHN